jgi:hypothetical protein
MGSHHAVKTKDPDPTPAVTASSGQEATAAEQDQKRKLKSGYGREKTILAGDTSASADGKRTILGG